MDNQEFKADIDGKEVSFKVVSPSFSHQREAQKVYNKTFSDAINSGSIIRARLDDILVRQGLWDDGKEQEFKELQNKINGGEKTLSEGGISLEKAKEIAVDMRTARDDLRKLISVKNQLDNNTAEGQADNAKFNYLVSACVVYKDSGKPYFENYEDYNNRAADIVAIRGAQKLANMIYGLDDNFEANLPENKFLKDYGFVNENLEFVDEQGRKVDVKGRLIDKYGRFIDEEGNYVDADGNKVTLEGDYISEFKPFLDKKGKPVKLQSSEEETEEEQKKAAVKRKPRRKKIESET